MKCPKCGSAMLPHHNDSDWFYCSSSICRFEKQFQSSTPKVNKDE